MKALIVGAGIGGLAAALALRRKGIAVRVFERAGDMRRIQVGGGFHMWPNAMRALRALELEERVAAVGTPIEVSEFRTWRGATLGRWPVGDIGRKLGVPNFGVSRADLHKSVLGAAIEPEIIELGVECTGFSQDEGGVVAHFSGGREEHADVLIGAEGAQSGVRAQLLGPAKPNFSGYTQWQGILDFQHEAFAVGDERVLFGRGARCVMHHVGGGRFFWAGVTYNPPTGNGVGASDAQKTALLAKFEGWQAPIGQAIAATENARISWIDVYDRPPVPRWGEGRVTLLGDAAHLMTTNLGQGAAMSIEDAVVLARCLGDGGGDIPAALRAYEARRMPRTASVTNLSKRISNLGGLRNPAACGVRDTFLKFVLSGVGLRQHEQDMAYDF